MTFTTSNKLLRKKSFGAKTLSTLRESDLDYSSLKW